LIEFAPPRQLNRSTASNFMSSIKKYDEEKMTRRDFICGAATIVAGVSMFSSEAMSQQSNVPVTKALDDPNVIHGKVTFKSGADTIDGYLSRPKAKGRYPIVIVVAGNVISEEYIPNTTAILAQGSFVGLAPNIFSLQTDSMSAEEKRKIFTTQITDERVFADIQAGIDFLKRQSFVKRKHIGITGFCFGGRIALMFAAQSKEIDAVVPFYGTLRLPPDANRAVNPFDIVSKIKAPVQGHYALRDAGITQPDVKKFFNVLQEQGTRTELYNYDAEHGFFAYTRPVYNAQAAKLAQNRMLEFFKKHLK
jgi:carboxymethylenebutenolidase